MGEGARVVVGVAIASSGRVLAARRASPPELAGGWEFPGGKVEPDETPEAAARREIREELGCEIEVTGWLPGEEPIAPGFVLRVALARLVAGEPVPVEHDMVWWLPREELGRVGWLGADVGFVEGLMGSPIGSKPHGFAPETCGLDPIGGGNEARPR